MFAPNNIAGHRAKTINIVCLLTAIAAILILPLKKEIWYDETVSILCSKGVSHDTPSLFSNTGVVSSATINDLNTAKNVFNATVLDNANSFLYNVCLHWFTLLFGNGIAAYMLLSKLCGIAALIAFFVLCNWVFKNNIFTSAAIILLAADNVFMGMGHEIRAYAMGVFFVTLASVYFFRYINDKPKPVYLFLTGLFSVGAILSHFLCAYIILAFLVVLVYTKRAALFSYKNMLAMLLPACLLGLFFYCSYPGLQVMSAQNRQIQAKSSNLDFSLWEVFFRSMKFAAMNFKAVFPAFMERNPVYLISFLFIICLYIISIKATTGKTVKRDLHLLFILGISGILFQGFLAARSHHYTALYYRYYSFCVPFSCLFTAFALYRLFINPKINRIVIWGLLTVIIMPSIALSVLVNKNTNIEIKYNHPLIAKEIVNEKVTKIEVPRWRDAFLVSAFLPRDYKIDYVLNPNATNFTLYKATSVEKTEVIKDDL